MARHDDDRGIALRRQRVQDHRFFAFARACKEPHRPIAEGASPSLAASHQDLIRREVKLQVADDFDVARTHVAESLAVSLALGEHDDKPRDCFAHQRRVALHQRVGAFRQACVDERHRHVLLVGDREQVRPRFGFNRDTKTRPKCAQEASHRVRQVVGQIGLQHAARPARGDFGAGRSTGRRHMSQQKARLRIALSERIDQRFGGARFAERHGMNPDQRALASERVALEAETLRPMRPIFRLSPRAPQQVESGQWRSAERQRGVRSASERHALRLITCAAASITSATVGGTVALPTLATASPVSPTSAGS